jgi:hypothetical protein
MAIRSVGIFVPLPTMTRRAQRDERLVPREHGVELVAMTAHQLRALVCNCIDRQQLKILRSSEESELALLARSGEFREPSTDSGAITLSADWPEPPIEWESRSLNSIPDHPNRLSQSRTEVLSCIADRIDIASALTGDTLLELRTSGRQNRAHQTLLPPSVADGERRQWSVADDFAPRIINATHLRQAAGWLAVGCLVFRHLGETPARRPRRDLHRLLWEADHQLGRAAYGWLGLPAPEQLAAQARKSHAAPRPRFGYGEPDLNELAAVIPNIGYGWEEWNKIGLALFAASGGSEEGRRAFDAFSRKSPKYSPAAVNERWTNFGRWPPSNTGIGKLLALAWEARR